MGKDGDVKQIISGNRNTQINSGKDTIAAIGAGAMAAGGDINILHQTPVCEFCNSVSPVKIACMNCQKNYCCDICYSDHKERLETRLAEISEFCHDEDLIDLAKKQVTRNCGECENDYFNKNSLIYLDNVNSYWKKVYDFGQLFSDNNYDIYSLPKKAYEDIFSGNFIGIYGYICDLFEQSIPMIMPSKSGVPSIFLDEYANWAKETYEWMLMKFLPHRDVLDYWNNESFSKDKIVIEPEDVWYLFPGTSRMGGKIFTVAAYKKFTHVIDLVNVAWSDGRPRYNGPGAGPLHPIYKFKECKEIMLEQGWNLECEVVLENSKSYTPFHDKERFVGMVFLTFSKNKEES